MTELLSKHYEKRAIPAEKLLTKLAAASPVTFLKLTNTLVLLQFSRRLDNQKCSLDNDKRVLKISARKTAILTFAGFIAHLMSFKRKSHLVNRNANSS